MRDGEWGFGLGKWMENFGRGYEHEERREGCGLKA